MTMRRPSELHISGRVNMDAGWCDVDVSLVLLYCIIFNADGYEKWGFLMTLNIVLQWRKSLVGL